VVKKHEALSSNPSVVKKEGRIFLWHVVHGILKGQGHLQKNQAESSCVTKGELVFLTTSEKATVPLILSLVWSGQKEFFCPLHTD
jgi:hypothetical protein